METLTATNPNAMYWSNSMVRGPKKTKIVQSAWCEVCKIDCNSKDVLAQHKLGKKHKKNLKKIQKAKKGAAMKIATLDLETKKQKIMANGAAAEQVRMCAICIVVCNSETVFNFHLAGQKHAAQGKKASGAATEEVRMCAICNVVCNSEIVFNFHLAGQKPAAQVKKVAEAAMSTTTQGVVKKIVPPTAPIEDLETKKRKIMASGAAAEEVRMCAICNVVCNSETVFNFHLAGQKHVAQVKKASGAATEEVRMCAICNVVCNSETYFNFHLAGQKHAAQVKKVAEAGGAFVTV